MKRIGILVITFLLVGVLGLGVVPPRARAGGDFAVGLAVGVGGALLLHGALALHHHHFHGHHHYLGYGHGHGGYHVGPTWYFSGPTDYYAPSPVCRQDWQPGYWTQVSRGDGGLVSYYSAWVPGRSVTVCR